MESPYSTARPEWTESHLCNLLVKYKNIKLISVVWFWMATEMLAPIFENINNLKTQDATSSILSFVLLFNKK